MSDDELSYLREQAKDMHDQLIEAEPLLTRLRSAQDLAEKQRESKALWVKDKPCYEQTNALQGALRALQKLVGEP